MRLMCRGVFLGFALTATLVAQTVPQELQVSRLKINRTEFSNVGSVVDLRSMADKQNKDVNRQINMFTVEGPCGSACARDTDQNSFRVKEAVAQSNLVVIGRVASQVSALTENNGFVVTDSELVVSEVLKPYAGVIAGSEITIASAGGTVYLDGHKITATLSNLRTFQTGGRYVLFLKFLPNSNSYMPIDLAGYDISEANVVPMNSTVSVPSIEKKLSNSTLLLNGVRASVAHQMEEAK